MISDTLVPLGKMKTGVYDASSVVDVMQYLMDDMQLACYNLDHASVDRIYRRYLCQMEKGVVSKCLGEHATHLTGGGPFPEEGWQHLHQGYSFENNS